MNAVMNCTENKALYSMCCMLTSAAILLKTDLNDNDLKREGVNVIVQSKCKTGSSVETGQGRPV